MSEAKHIHSENQGRSRYSMYTRNSHGEKFFGDYPTRTRALYDAIRLAEDSREYFYSITLEDNFDEDACWNLEETGEECQQYCWVEIDVDEDRDEEEV